MPLTKKISQITACRPWNRKSCRILNWYWRWEQYLTCWMTRVQSVHGTKVHLSRPLHLLKKPCAARMFHFSVVLYRLLRCSWCNGSASLDYPKLHSWDCSSLVVLNGLTTTITTLDAVRHTYSPCVSTKSTPHMSDHTDLSFSSRWSTSAKPGFHHSNHSIHSSHSAIIAHS